VVKQRNSVDKGGRTGAFFFVAQMRRPLNAFCTSARGSMALLLKYISR
jgi:hypothetical protein